MTVAATLEERLQREGMFIVKLLVLCKATISSLDLSSVKLLVVLLLGEKAKSFPTKGLVFIHILWNLVIQFMFSPAALLLTSKLASLVLEKLSSEE